jgi:hypothetical protein
MGPYRIGSDRRGEFIFYFPFLAEGAGVEPAQDAVLRRASDAMPCRSASPLQMAVGAGVEPARGFPFVGFRSRYLAVRSTHYNGRDVGLRSLIPCSQGTCPAELDDITMMAEDVGVEPTPELPATCLANRPLAV